MKRTLYQNLFEKKIKIDPSVWQLHLEEHGWAVIPNVFTLEECEKYKSRFWDWLESFGTGLKRDSRESWMREENWPPNRRGLLQHYGVGHADFVWDLRLDPRVIEIFANIWQTDDLLVSFDGACASRPEKKESYNKSWAHCDQGPRLAGKYECIQGLVTLSAAGPGQGGLVVYDGSHKLHKQFFEKFPGKALAVLKSGKPDWVLLEPQHRQWYFEQGVQEIQPAAPPGSILLWNSSTIHYARRPAVGEKHCRMAVYLCYQPRNKANEAMLKKKQNAFTKRRMTNHWAARPKLFPEKFYPVFDTSILERFSHRPTVQQTTPLMLKLAGF